VAHWSRTSPAPSSAFLLDAGEHDSPADPPLKDSNLDHLLTLSRYGERAKPGVSGGQRWKVHAALAARKSWLGRSISAVPDDMRSVPVTVIRISGIDRNF